MRNRMQKLAAIGAMLAVTGSAAMAQTDITTALDTVTDYKAAAIVIGIAIFLFVLGRKVVKRLV